MWTRIALDTRAGTKPLTRLLIACALTLLAVTAGVLYARGSEPAPSSPAETEVGSGFTYQGHLQREGRPVDDACWFAFRLYDDAITGTQIGDAITTTAPLTVSDGLFSVVLNASGEFGAQAFQGDARWLDVRVKCPSDPTFTALGRHRRGPRESTEGRLDRRRRERSSPRVDRHRRQRLRRRGHLPARPHRHHRHARQRHHPPLPRHR